MRSRYPIPHDRIKYYPDLLKDAGYYVGNARKTDYNIGGRDDKSAWDTDKVNWRKLKNTQPFFQVINCTKSHESKAFGDVDKSTHSPAEVRLAEYHPDITVIRQNYAHYHDQVKKMDADIGKALARLEANGLAENTIVIHNSDHGGVIARSKRFLFNSGTHCPLIIRIPEKFKHLRPGKPGTKVHDLVSFIDMTRRSKRCLTPFIPARQTANCVRWKRSLGMSFLQRTSLLLDQISDAVPQALNRIPSSRL